MVASFVVFALLAGVAWGASPIPAKRGLAAGGSFLQATLVVLLVSTAFFWAALLVLGNPATLFRELSPAIVLVFLASGVIGTGLGRVATYAGIHRVGASINSAVVGTRPLFATFIAVLWLGEQVSPQIGVGIVLIIVGTVVLSLSRGGDIRGWERYELLFPFVAAAAYASGNVIRRFGLTTSPVTLLEALALNELGALVVMLGYARLRDEPTDLRGMDLQVYGPFALSAVLSIVGIGTLFTALSQGPVVIVDPVYGTAPLWAALFTYVFLKDLEEVTARLVVGATIIIAGATLISVA